MWSFVFGISEMWCCNYITMFLFPISTSFLPTSWIFDRTNTFSDLTMFNQLFILYENETKQILSCLLISETNQFLISFVNKHCFTLFHKKLWDHQIFNKVSPIHAFFTRSYNEKYYRSGNCSETGINIVTESSKEHTRFMFFKDCHNRI